MFEYLATLPLTSWVLDLGSSAGSFDANLTPAHLVRVDLQTKPTDRGGEFLQADAGRMPLRNHCLDVVVANHCFEHFVNLGQALDELGRTIKPTGTVFISVPDATTLTDRIYRWLGRGGGHVNPFTRASELPELVTAATGLPLTATVLLHSGLSFLNRRNMTTVQKKLLLLGGGHASVLRLATLALRSIDRGFGTRLSVYGWAYYFGAYQPSDLAARTNVCIGCGGGHSARKLRAAGLVKRGWWVPSYACPDCGSRNFFTPDQS